MAQLSKCLPFKLQDLSLIPETVKKNSVVVPKPCNPSIGEAEAEKSLGLTGQPVQPHRQAQGSVRNLVSQQWWKAREKEIKVDFWLHMHTHIPAQTEQKHTRRADDGNSKEGN